MTPLPTPTSFIYKFKEFIDKKLDNISLNDLCSSKKIRSKTIKKIQLQTNSWNACDKAKKGKQNFIKFLNQLSHS